MLTATLMRIFVDEAERAGKQPLYVAIVETLKRHGFGGATVLKGIEGFGARLQVHSTRALDFSTSLPVLIEVAEAEETIQSVIPALREMIPEGLITLERIQMKLLHVPPDP
jgi:PII-like signaling protein